MKSKKANLIVNLVCAFLICVFGAISVYAAIQYTHNTSSTISFTATSVSGSVSVSLSGVTEAVTNPSTWSFNAKTSANQIATQNFNYGDTAFTITDNGIATLAITISNTTPDAKMGVALNGFTIGSPLTIKDDIVITERANGAGTATTVSVNNADNPTIFSPIQINSSSSSIIYVAIKMPTGTASWNGSLSFHIDLTRGTQTT